ncbi:hypothetical protein ACHQM5_018827 [Ranunculus cassubicifolius]
MSTLMRLPSSITRFNSFPVLQPKPNTITPFHPSQFVPRDDFSSMSLFPLFRHSQHARRAIRSSNPYPMHETIEHIVLFKMKPSANLDILIQELNNLRHLPGVLYLTSGYVFEMYSSNSRCEFTIFVHSRFRSKQDLDAYMCHPKKLRFTKTYTEIYYEDYMIVDWVTYHQQPLVNPIVGSALRVTLFKLKDEGWGRICEVIGEELGEAVVQQTFGQSYIGRTYRPAAKGFSIASLGVFEGVYKLRALDESVEFGKKLEEKLKGAVEEVMVIDYIVSTVYPQQVLLADNRALRYLPNSKLMSNISVPMLDKYNVSPQRAALPKSKSTVLVSMSEMSNVSTQQTTLPNSKPKSTSSLPMSETASVSTEKITLPTLKLKLTRSVPMPETTNVSTQQTILPESKPNSSSSIPMPETASVSTQQTTLPKSKPKSTSSIPMLETTSVSTEQTTLPKSKPNSTSSTPMQETASVSTEQTTLPNLKPKPTRSVPLPEKANVSTPHTTLPKSKPNSTSSVPMPSTSSAPMPEITDVSTSHETPSEPKPKPRVLVEMSYIPPTFNEDFIIIDKETEDEGVAFLEGAIVGFFLHKKLPQTMVENHVKETWNLCGEVEISQNGTSYLFRFKKEDDRARILENHVKETWNLCGEIEILEDGNLFYFRFKNEDDRERILDEGSFLIDGKRFIVRPWTQEIEDSRGVIENIPIWVKLYNVPKHLWSVKGLSMITSFFGRPLYMDRLIEERKMSYARVCVDVTAEKELPEAVEIKFSSGKTATVPVKFEWEPQICTKCKVFGHTTRNCVRAIPKITPLESAKPQYELQLEDPEKHEQETTSSELNEHIPGIATTRKDHGATSENGFEPYVVEETGMATVSIPVIIPETESVDSESNPMPSIVSPPKKSLISTLPCNNRMYAGTLLFALQFLFALGVANV